MRPIDWAWTQLGLGLGQIIGVIVTVIWVGQTGFMAGVCRDERMHRAEHRLLRILRVDKRDRT